MDVAVWHNPIGHPVESLDASFSWHCHRSSKLMNRGSGVETALFGQPAPSRGFLGMAAHDVSSGLTSQPAHSDRVECDTSLGAAEDNTFQHNSELNTSAGHPGESSGWGAARGGGMRLWRCPKWIRAVSTSDKAFFAAATRTGQQFISGVENAVV